LLGVLVGAVLIASPAYADRVINGCTIVCDPTIEHHTVSERADRGHVRNADLHGADETAANLTGALR
jgi:hypothetical protein